MACVNVGLHLEVTYIYVLVYLNTFTIPALIAREHVSTIPHASGKMLNFETSGDQSSEKTFWALNKIW